MTGCLPRSSAAPIVGEGSKRFVDEGGLGGSVRIHGPALESPLQIVVAVQSIGIGPQGLREQVEDVECPADRGQLDPELRDTVGGLESRKVAGADGAGIAAKAPGQSGLGGCEICRLNPVTTSRSPLVTQPGMDVAPT